GTVFGYVLRSPHAHARIRSIDTGKAKAAPGVLAVLTGADWQASGWGDLPVPGGLKRRDGSVFKPPYPALVADRVRWVGDYVAFVVAETYLQALDAAELIAVDYEPLPAVVSTAEASAAGAPRVWDGCADNIGFVQLFGDKAAADAAFAKADHIVKHRLVINRVTAASMEPRGCLGDYNATEGRYTIYTTLQRVHPFRAELSPILKVPESDIRVVAGDIGGSFGMKSAVYNEVALVLLASKVVGRPVKWVSTRSEAFVCDAQARDNVTEAELALDKNGSFLAMRAKVIASIGAYLQTGMPAFTGNIGTLAGVYRIPAMHADVTAVFTHTNPVRPYRGNGRPEAAYVIERLVDLAADELGIDPAELRRKNYIPSDAMPFKTALTFTYDSGEFEKSMDMALELADFRGFERRRSEARKRGKLRGIGLSNTIERAAAGGFEAAEIRFDKSGAVTLLAGSVTQGQGHETIFKQIMCDRLGVDPDEVHYIQGDTDQVFVGEGTGGSRSATLGGSAVDVAAQRITTKGKAIAAHLLQLDAADVNFADGVFSSPKTNRTLTIKEVAKEAMEPTRLPKDMDVGLIATATYVAPVQNFPNGCHICELEIDEDTGEVEIVRYSVVDDVGTVINPLLLKGQIVGGVAQGVGQILMEDIQFDGDGQILTGSFMDYAMPRATDISAVEVKSNPVPTRTNPLGVKGAGEAGCVGAMPAVANALVDALSHLGIRHIEMPATPERLWRAIHHGNTK
ncbi:MAG TPA: xanthine dehydrogenase family protein molybdopterin-binding subunit, partial [Xanthobacteraceae bacterium]|nr:xanthine dehydrogenase family protein molybdopterin-binding subunit [Xanthobacteraceae bacterium]